MNEGGSLYGKGNTFELSPGFQYIKNDFVDVKRDKQILEGDEELEEYQSIYLRPSMAYKIYANYRKLADDDISNHITDEALKEED